ncbi:conserved hypothetical protein [Gloeothece citriformis PCC 7424]|uniref:PRC-barrel domain-containing protein n=1 Tax=Gloeothece citriformis (strain PCC 7424) TaxID=65393 RepID=B7KC50_GLOC7|nr:hypothetical protein [Gloeothece citriformis]ACK68873.1 conserved hypothetical protein [Gloeothece citriformis PCC 7424]
MNNISRTFAGATALLSVAVFCPNPANAEPTEQLISQLRGHDEYTGEADFEASRYNIGRVRGITGNILSIELFEPVVIGDREIKSINVTATQTVARQMTSGQVYNDIGYPLPGDDVGLVYEDDQWQIIGRYHPYWVTRLDLKEVPVVERSAFEWDPQPFGLPPLQPSPVVIEREPAPAPAPEPVQGLW